MLAMIIIVFFFFFGCAYELVNYYLTDQPEEDDENNINNNNYEGVNDNTGRNTYINSNVCRLEVRKPKPKPKIVVEEGWTTKKILICCLLACLGILLQPLYLLFYILIGVMECYRRFACWYFYF